MDFQQVVMCLSEFWADQGCLIWQPYNVQMGAGTMNPATVLRVLGPEPWRVAYLEPSVRPADGRYGKNPNRWQQFYQYQVILKPDPGNPQEIYLESLRRLGIDTSTHDVRFVEDNWESPALGAWGLGWEVWLDGQEITQYTYFQQAGGIDLDPVSVEITYGLERIVMVLQGVRAIPEIRWTGEMTYGDVLLRGEVEHCTYNFQVADVDRLRQMYDLCELEASGALERGLVMPAHDYVLKCSHVFNVLDSRGAIGVTERARYFVRMRDLAREVAALYLGQREEMGHPFGDMAVVAPPEERGAGERPGLNQPEGEGPFDFLLEIGSEELPVGDLDSGLVQLEEALSRALNEARLTHEGLRVIGTPRRLVAYVRGLIARQRDEERVIRGPSVNVAFDERGAPTRAAQGFARSRGVELSDLKRRLIEGKEYVVAVLTERGREAGAVLAEILPQVVASLRFPLSMRWNPSGARFSRPLRWLVALLNDVVVPFEYAGVQSGRVSRGTRPSGSPDLPLSDAASYVRTMEEAGITLDVGEREARILKEARSLAEGAGGEVLEDGDLLREVANLVESPLAILGRFDREYLRLPMAVLLAVMKEHQRYLPVVRNDELMPHFISVANGTGLDLNAVRHGNEEVLRARYADAAYFCDADTSRRLGEYTPRLAGLTFQEELGSVLDKVRRLERLTVALGEILGLSSDEAAAAARAASLCKSDLATQLVIELTSLQGKMGRHYAELSGEREDVALAVEEHYLPRFMGDRLPDGMAGVVVGLADRLDTLVGLFAVGIRPSGAADPWGLRRSALGLVQLLVGKRISLSLPQAFLLAAESLPLDVGEGALAEVLAFVTRRYRGYLLDEGFRHDMVDAVLNERGNDPHLAFETLQQFIPWVERDDWQELLDTYARCVRIARDETATYAVHRERMTEPGTVALYEAYCRAAANLDKRSTVDEFLGAMEELKPFIERFFDQVMVMSEDAVLRRNRLGVLQAIAALAEGIVDLTAMEGF